MAAALALRARGEQVTGCDSGAVEAAARAELEAAGVAVHESHATASRCSTASRRSSRAPACREAPVVRAARERGVLVLGELELGWRLVPNEVIAITGSNGKTTTTELVGQIHREAGLPVAVAGNVGTALSSLAGALDPAAVVVCEASSFQLEDTLAFAPDAAVLLNLAPDHLDRHGSFDRLPRRQAAHLRQPGAGRARGRARRASTRRAGAPRRVRVADAPPAAGRLAGRRPEPP